MLGVDYGFEVLLVSLIDTIDENLPCHGENICFSKEFFEILFATLERYLPLATRPWK